MLFTLFYSCAKDLGSEFVLEYCKYLQDHYMDKSLQDILTIVDKLIQVKM